MRVLDLLASSIGLVLLSPLLLAAALCIKLTSPGPVFYRAVRVGKGGKLFGLYKFRTMVVNADKLGPGITCGADPRITRVGRFLRNSKIDELPQLANVLKGEMSLVGPRPEDPRYVAFYNDEQRLVLRFRPGITSPASLHYRDESSLLRGDFECLYVEHILPHKLALELDYCRTRTVLTDLHFILLTIAALLWRSRPSPAS